MMTERHRSQASSGPQRSSEGHSVLREQPAAFGPTPGPAQHVPGASTTSATDVPAKHAAQHRRKVFCSRGSTENA